MNHEPEKLKHGQALAIQWVVFALQKLSLDVKRDGRLSRSLLGDAKTTSGADGLETLALGCKYVVNFVLPFAIELSLKSLITKEKIIPLQIHDLLLLFDSLPLNLQGKLESRYHQLSEKSFANDCKCFRQLLIDHKVDFVNWRYLDEMDILKNEEIKLQYALTSVLDVFNDSE
ncbi:MAG: hypothetical protein PHY72_02870 [Candidatus Pacebacteria bacterium]|nr:hypothetical protein [Candidatus Paceibacterota bacterium]